MPPTPAATGDGFQVRVRGHIEGQETNNVLHFIAVGPVDDVEVRLILVLAACFVQHLVPVCSTQWALQDLVWKQVTPVLGVEHITVPPGILVGTATGDALPAFCSAVISLRTRLGGRSHRGRMYVAGMPESATVGSVIQGGGNFWTGFLAFINCVATSFILGDPPPANSFQWEVYSRKLGGAKFPYASAGYTPITSILPVAQVGTTRSRKVGRGA
jgi:hypothetical protein